jgi:hypothetical protein
MVLTTLEHELHSLGIRAVNASREPDKTKRHRVGIEIDHALRRIEEEHGIIGSPLQTPYKTDMMAILEILYSAILHDVGDFD